MGTQPLIQNEEEQKTKESEKHEKKSRKTSKRILLIFPA